MLPRRPDCAELTGPAQQRHPGVEMPGQDQTSAIFSRRQHVVFVQRQSLFAGGEGFFDLAAMKQHKHQHHISP